MPRKSWFFEGKATEIFRQGPVVILPCLLMSIRDQADSPQPCCCSLLPASLASRAEDEGYPLLPKPYWVSIAAASLRNAGADLTMVTRRVKTILRLGACGC